MSLSPDTKHFIALRKELTEIRTELKSADRVLTPQERDIVTLAQAEALCDLAATMNNGIIVGVEQ
ncbi:hypothetical protein ELQ92_02180 [Labedella populi]|uniref:Uncharacterized protein n=1 Tax=Labedella populi TaxID=2498850 RepID=A0A444QEW8_9MICO|nr:hypothetical protein [Labedella populi]RWZ68080.1 hypothetical protein ELQ92_02180 [Labedella populi]